MPDPTTRPTLRPLHTQTATVDHQQGYVLTDPLGVAEPAFVPMELAPLLSRFDGSATAADIAAALSTELGQNVPARLVDQLAADLDARHMLQSPRYLKARDAAVEQFLTGGTRPCRHAGSAGYPEDADQLDQALRAMVPDPQAPAPGLSGLVAPHIDLARGHGGYAAAYGRLLAAEPAELYVLFGTGHQGPSAPVTGLPLDWQTPLGTATTDRAFVAAVHESLGQPTPEDLLLHRDEHSLEFQVLMLQHLSIRRGSPPPRVACFLCGALPSADGDPTAEPYLRKITTALRAAAAASGQRICYVAGADLAHLGPLFGDSDPIDQALQERLESDERVRLAHLLRGQPGAFHRAIEGHGNPDRICSAPAITLTALLARGAGQLLHYEQATAADRSQLVSFCAMAFGGPAAESDAASATQPDRT
ncbi:MAG: AmmeMemoRadiSam system protein B [Planctomycetota bacterium]|nr:AmmeMemoRadiSam system protein B [Planctomycetota bacterium]